MPKELKISCDSCGRDLTSTTNCEDYRIALLNDSIPSIGEPVTAMAVYPPLRQDHYLCDIKCLKEFVVTL